MVHGAPEHRKRSNRPCSIAIPSALVAVLAAFGCATSDGTTLAALHSRTPDLEEVEIGDGLHQAMEGYRAFLEEAATSSLTPEAMRRLADLKLEKEFGPRGAVSQASAPPSTSAGRPSPDRTVRDEAMRALPAPDANAASRPPASAAGSPLGAAKTAARESDRDFEERTTSGKTAFRADPSADPLSTPEGNLDATTGPREAIELYDRILDSYPDYAQMDQVLYQKARALDELGRVDEAIEVAATLVDRFPESRHADEIAFRRGEYFFTRKKFLEAERAYESAARHGPVSDYYELALYKLGWSFYKQMMLDEALESFVHLLDHKVSSGYDFDQTEDEADQQRIADTYRVVSLCFSDLGGAEAIARFFSDHGARSYEDRVYRQMGEFYLEKLRYADAADAYQTFVDLYPNHARSPSFSGRIVEIYETGGFPKLVLASKREFASRYGLASSFWGHHSVEAMPEVVDLLKQTLEDLANHYHALYQEPDESEHAAEHFSEATRWYAAYLTDFPAEPETPAIHYRLADLRLENEDFSEAAVEYERIAYEYEAHERSSDAGYAAIYAHRERLKHSGDEARRDAQRAAIASTLRFVEWFPEHEHAATVLGAAVDDLHALADHEAAIAQGRFLVASYPQADVGIRRSAWLVIAHASFDTGVFTDAEEAYGEVLAITPTDDESRPEIVNNLAASIYRQGETAREAGDHRKAADEFLRLAQVAPRSDIRPMAEYDAGVSLVALEDWSGAAAVFEGFRDTFPNHELASEATRQIAAVYRSADDPGRSAEEYARVAAEAGTPDLRRESLLVSGGLFVEADLPERAIEILQLYVDEFPEPLADALATRFELASLHDETGDADARVRQLRRIVELDRSAGSSRTPEVRGFAARAALALAELDFAAFVAIRLELPFERSLERKQQSMQHVIARLGDLVDYEVGDVTAAATFYMAEVYDDFSRSLLDSERPGDLSADDLVQYELVLEEEAYPFEEKSIEVHEKNLELMAAGVFNRWIEKSIGELAVVMPGRYAKAESSPGLLRSPRRYSYVAPGVEVEPTTVASTEGGLDQEALAESEQPESIDEPDVAQTTAPRSGSSSARRRMCSVIVVSGISTSGTGLRWMIMPWTLVTVRPAGEGPRRHHPTTVTRHEASRSRADGPRPVQPVPGGDGGVRPARARPPRPRLHRLDGRGRRPSASGVPDEQPAHVRRVRHRLGGHGGRLRQLRRTR